MFGEYLPNTAIAKSQGLPGLAAATRSAELVAYLDWPAALLAVAAVGACWPGRRHSGEPLVVLLVLLTLAVTAFGVREPDWMGEPRFATRSGRWERSPGSSPPRWPRRGSQPGVGPSRPCWRWGRPPSPVWSSSMVLVNAARAFRAALVSDLRVVDMVGLADRRIARFWAVGDMVGLRDHFVDDVRPTFVTFNGEWARHAGLLGDKITTSPAGVTTGCAAMCSVREISRRSALARPRPLSSTGIPADHCGRPVDVLIPMDG